LVIGGYGNFGTYIARSLAPDPQVRLLIGGRSQAKADAFASGLGAANPAEGYAVDIDRDLAAVLAHAKPDVVIHTTGPFQQQDYRVAQACIAQGCHYLDLADARHFVTGIVRLDAAARARNLLVVSGASSVPCLTAAVVDRYRPDFARLERVDYGISAAQQTNRGLATTSAVLSYVGRPFTRLRGGRMERCMAGRIVTLYATRSSATGCSAIATFPTSICFRIAIRAAGRAFRGRARTQDPASGHMGARLAGPARAIAVARPFRRAPAQARFRL
jgi:hypothetical protein